jgi:hypothetical protein
MGFKFELVTPWTLYLWVGSNLRGHLNSNRGPDYLINSDRGPDYIYF